MSDLVQVVLDIVFEGAFDLKTKGRARRVISERGGPLRVESLVGRMR